MNKTVLIMFLLLGINLNATERVKCEELFKGAIYNFYLENSCKFNKHVSSALRKEFEKQNCTKMFSDENMKKLNSKVLGESYTAMNEMGRDDFCKSNKTAYDALVKQ